MLVSMIRIFVLILNWQDRKNITDKVHAKAPNKMETVNHLYKNLKHKETSLSLLFIA